MRHSGIKKKIKKAFSYIMQLLLQFSVSLQKIPLPDILNVSIK